MEMTSAECAVLLGTIKEFGSHSQEEEQTPSFCGTVISEEHDEQLSAAYSYADAYEQRSEPSRSRPARPTAFDLLDLKEDWKKGQEACDKSHELHEIGSRRKKAVSELDKALTTTAEKHMAECICGSALSKYYDLMRGFLKVIADLENQAHELGKAQVGRNFAIAERQKDLYAFFAGGLGPDASDASRDHLVLKQKAEASTSTKEVSSFTQGPCFADAASLDPKAEPLAEILQSSLQIRDVDVDDFQNNPGVLETSFEEDHRFDSLRESDSNLGVQLAENCPLGPIDPRFCAASLPAWGGQFAQRSCHSGSVSAKYNGLLKPSSAMREVRRQDLDQILALDLSAIEPPLNCFGGIANAAEHRSLYSAKGDEGLAHRPMMTPGHSIALWSAGKSQNTWTEVQRFLQYGDIAGSWGHVFVSDGPGGNMFQFVRNMVNPFHRKHAFSSADRAPSLGERGNTSQRPTHPLSAVESNP